MDIANKICPDSNCTACGGCIQICPTGCVFFESDNCGVRFAAYTTDKCISCNKCRMACPQITPRVGARPEECFAAWSENNETRKKSASGGVATEIYRYFAEHGRLFSGVEIDSDYTAAYKLMESTENYRLFQNSKYVESFTNTVFIKIGEALKNKKEIVFVGLPCHVAGLKGYLETQHIPTDKIIFVDIVCHGTAPSVYLLQHIKSIQNIKHTQCTKVSFRDPAFGTHTFTFTLRKNDKLLYKKRVYRNDAYQIGYHYSLIYRNNCYRCQYACPSRQGDLTLSDFSGLGKKAPWNGSKHSVSCVLVNTGKGKNLLNSLMQGEYIHCEKRPLEEALKYEQQLISPSQIRKERGVFLSEYSKTHDYERAMKIAAKRIIIRNELKYYLKIEMIKRVITFIIPRRIKQAIRKAV